MRSGTEIVLSPSLTLREFINIPRGRAHTPILVYNNILNFRWFAFYQISPAKHTRFSDNFAAFITLLQAEAPNPTYNQFN